jgi:hypothetical protein
MPRDRRLRERLDRLTSEIDPDVDRNLDRTFGRARRTIAVRRAGAVIAIAASVVIAIVVLPPAIDALRDAERDRPAASPSLNKNPAVIGGTYYRTLIPNDQPAVRQNGLAGLWTIGLGTDGIMTVSAPSSFTGVLSGSLFQIRGDQFRTNLFVQDVCSNLPMASYRWTSSGSQLTFTPLDDSCEGRVAVLTSAPWDRVG